MVIFILSVVCDMHACMLPLITLFVCFTLWKCFERDSRKHRSSIDLPSCHDPCNTSQVPSLRVSDVMLVSWELHALVCEHKSILFGCLSSMWDDPATIYHAWLKVMETNSKVMIIFSSIWRKNMFKEFAWISINLA